MHVLSLVAGLNSQRIKVRLIDDGVSFRFESSRQAAGQLMDSFCNSPESTRTMIDSIHTSYDGQQDLGRADITCRLLAADVLLARLKCKAAGRVAMYIFGYANKASWQ